MSPSRMFRPQPFVLALSLFSLPVTAIAGVPQAAMSVFQMDAPDPVAPGGALSYTITVSNKGPDAAASAVLDGAVPTGTTFVSLAPPGGWSCTTPAVGALGAIQCTQPSFAPGSDVFTLTVQVDAGAAPGTILQNTVTVSSATADPQPGDESDTAPTTVGGTSSGLTLAITDAPDPVAAGSDVSYTVTLSSTLADAADGTLTVQLPARTTFQSFTPAAGWSCSTPAVGGTGSVVCTNPSPPAPGIDAFTLVVRVDSSVADGDTFQASASLVLTTSGRDVVATDAENTTALGIADLSATKTVSGGFVPGAPVTFTIVLTNSGGGAQGDNPGDELVDVLPPELVLISASATSGVAVATPGTNTVTWNGGVPAGGSVTVTVNATIGASVVPGTEILNQGTVSFDGNADGVNESVVLTDDPAQPGAADPTRIALAVPIAQVPTLGASGLALLALALAAGGVLRLRTRRRRAV